MDIPGPRAGLSCLNFPAFPSRTRSLRPRSAMAGHLDENISTRQPNDPLQPLPQLHAHGQGGLLLPAISYLRVQGLQHAVLPRAQMRRETMPELRLQGTARCGQVLPPLRSPVSPTRTACHPRREFVQNALVTGLSSVATAGTAPCDDSPAVNARGGGSYPAQVAAAKDGSMLAGHPDDRAVATRNGNREYLAPIQSEHAANHRFVLRSLYLMGIGN